MAKQVIITLEDADTANPTVTVVADGQQEPVQVLAQTQAGEAILAAGLHLIITNIDLALVHYKVGEV